MTTTVFSSPAAFLVESDDFREDARMIAGIEDTLFASALAELRDSRALLRVSELDELLKRYLSEEASGALIRFFLYLHRTKQAVRREQTAKNLVDALTSRTPGDDTLRKLETRILEIAGEFSAIEILIKARELAAATGEELSSLKFICDLRPVFDSPREVIEGYLPVATMHLVLESDSTAIDMVLTREELESMRSKVESALDKLKALEDVAKELRRG